MQANIERIGLDTLVRGVLGCVVAPLFEDVVQAYQALGDEKTVDFNALLEIAEGTAEYMPFHMLLEFTSWRQDDLSEFTITQNDVIRLFATKYHFDYLSNNLLNPMLVSDSASFLVNHMLLPMCVSEQNGTFQGEYVLDGHTMSVFPLFVPRGLEIASDTIYGVHMGSVLTPLSDAQVNMIQAQLALSEEFLFLAKHVDETDFTDFQYFGDFNQLIADRYQKAFG